MKTLKVGKYFLPQIEDNSLPDVLSQKNLEVLDCKASNQNSNINGDDLCQPVVVLRQDKLIHRNFCNIGSNDIEPSRSYYHDNGRDN